MEGEGDKEKTETLKKKETDAQRKTDTGKKYSNRRKRWKDRSI